MTYETKKFAPQPGHAGHTPAFGPTRTGMSIRPDMPAFGDFPVESGLISMPFTGCFMPVATCALKRSWAVLPPSMTPALPLSDTPHSCSGPVTG
ncbi:hypothetical protein MUA04_14245 [Enterobacteriaceae bacterium H11S18]|uniref:hypothetical protein n=1 Tax=Dryocola clanedunensis TaxID=2925396 RepID=UPI0022F0D8DD|nr:hypothetical protein [Dryocola clanedunensis]MCT4711341.1 hypothetical protein [Dryocola clanedunensis]